jgi:cytosine/adenosine deaminase-related metal-dependent hydrolase
MAAQSYTITARWIFPVDQPPLARGTVTIQGDQITAVDRHGMRTADTDFGNAAILPGFVNAHTHLDLSDALGQCPPTPDFTAWLRSVIAHRRRQTPADVANAIDVGLSQCLRYGTTLVGDISAAGLSWRQLAEAPLRAVVFLELLGLTQERAEHAFSSAQQWLADGPQTPTCRPGLSPHAPYSARASLLDDLRRESMAGPGGRRGQVPLAMHLAESEAELELLRDHKSPFVDFLTELGVWDPSGLARDAQQVAHALSSRRTLFVHGNYLPADVDIGEAALVYCPRTHAAFGHKPYPLQTFLQRGSRVALGTDSLASSPDLDMLAEARFVRRLFPDVPGATILKMATLNGASVLSWAEETGSLTPGKSADLVILPLPDVETGDPHDLVLESPLPIRATMFRGQLREQHAFSVGDPRPDRLDGGATLPGAHGHPAQ